MTVFKKPDWSKIIFVTSSLFLAVLMASCEIRTIDPKTGEVIIEEPGRDFSATDYVDEIWQDQVLSTIQSNAIELAKLLDSLNSNPGAAGKYGLVKGIGKVIKVDTTSRVGFLRLKIPDIGEQTEIRIQIGPVISGTALRDALPFIQFDRFTNQIQYAAVSIALHDKLMKTELGNLDYEELEGQMIRFRGALLYDEGEVVITPVTIEIAGP